MKDIMKQILASLPLMCLLLVLGACGAKQSADKISAEEKDHLWKSQEEALKKAQAVEDEVLKAAEEKRKEIEKQTR